MCCFFSPGVGVHVAVAHVGLLPNHGGLARRVGLQHIAEAGAGGWH